MFIVSLHYYYNCLIPQCAMEENCLAPEAYRLRRENPNFSLETRRLLRFTASIANIGNADFRPFIPKSHWQWHACHMHYHSMEVCMYLIVLILCAQFFNVGWISFLIVFSSTEILMWEVNLFWQSFYTNVTFWPLRLQLSSSFLHIVWKKDTWLS